MSDNQQLNSGSLHVVKSGEGEHWLVAGEVITVKISERDSSGAMLVLETLVPPGKQLSALARHQFVEAFYVAEGEVEFHTTDAAGQRVTFQAGLGDTVFVPPLAWHGFANGGSKRAKLVTMFNTTASEEITQAIGQRIADPTNPPKQAGMPSEEMRNKVGTLLQRYQVESIPLDKMPG